MVRLRKAGIGVSSVMVFIPHFPSGLELVGSESTVSVKAEKVVVAVGSCRHFFAARFKFWASIVAVWQLS